MDRTYFICFGIFKDVSSSMYISPKEKIEDGINFTFFYMEMQIFHIMKYDLKGFRRSHKATLELQFLDKRLYTNNYLYSEPYLEMNKTRTPRVTFVKIILFNNPVFIALCRLRSTRQLQ